MKIINKMEESNLQATSMIITGSTSKTKTFSFSETDTLREVVKKSGQQVTDPSDYFYTFDLDGEDIILEKDKSISDIRDEEGDIEIRIEYFSRTSGPSQVIEFSL